MGRPSKLSPEQREAITLRLAAGEGVRALAKEFGVDPSMISRWGVVQQTQRLRDVAQQVAEAQTALATLPVPQQYMALTLAEKLRNISTSLASAAELGAATSHRLHALANNEVTKLNDANPLASVESLKGVAVLTKMANDSAVVPLGLLSANRDAMQRINEGDQKSTVVDASTRAARVAQLMAEAKRRQEEG